VGSSLPLNEFLTAREVGAQLDVSRETLERLERYVDLLLKWQRVINLIGPSTADDIWRRHILDCGQLTAHLSGSGGPVIDIGSGAGFPGLVLAILGAPDVYLVEANSRKCAFLREVIRATGTDATVLNERVEEVRGLNAGVVTARAVASLDRLLELSKFLYTPDTLFIFPKGKEFKNELTELKNKWSMALTVLPSLSNAEGVILKLESLVRVDAAYD